MSDKKIYHAGMEAITALVTNVKEKYALLSHKHTKSDITDLIIDSSLSSTSANPVQNKAITTAIDEAETSANTYTDTKIETMVGTSNVSTQISNHNTSTSSHSDIRELISDLSTMVENFLDVDDTTADQLSEVLTLINNNKGTLESLTTSKINVSDIVDNLTTSSTSKVLSAKQGVAIKTLIDALQAEVDSKSDAGHGHAISEITNLQSTLNSKAATSHTHAASDIVSGVVTVPRGGTGADMTATESNAVIRKSSSGNYYSSTPSNNGALYATSQNGSIQFGILPIAQGGTGATTATESLTNLGAADAETVAYIDTFDSSEDIDENSLDYVDLISDQDVYGTKSFVDGVRIGDAFLSFDVVSGALVVSFNEGGE